MTKIKPKIYARVLCQLIKESKNIEADLKKFALLLVKHNKLSQAKNIIAQFHKIYNRQESNIDIEIESAYPLDLEIKNKIMDFAKDFQKAKSAVMHERINPDAIGGIKMNIDDLRLDATIKNKLNLIKENINK